MRRSRIGQGQRAALAMLGVPLAVVPLLGAALLGTVMPWERILRHLPGATAPDYASRFGSEFAPLRESYVRTLLGESQVPVPPRRGSRMPTLAMDGDGLFRKLPRGTGAKVSPGPPEERPAVEFQRSQSPSISEDGSVVAYQSTDTRIPGMGSEPCAMTPPGPTTVSIIWKYSRYTTEAAAPCVQVIVQDSRTGRTMIASVGNLGQLADSPVHTHMLSGNGRFVVFTTAATNLVAGDTNDTTDVFVRDLAAGRTELISVSIHGGPIRKEPQSYLEPLGVPGEVQGPDVLGSVGAETATISRDGRYVVFESSAPDLIQGDTPQSVDVFVRDRWMRTTERVSVSSAGMPAGRADVQADNRERLREIHLESAWPCMSSNGRYVAFRSLGSSLVPNDTNEKADLFIRDRKTNRTELVSVSSAGIQQNGDARPAIGRVFTNPQGYALKNCVSDDGRYVLFEAGSTNLVSNDTNGQWDIFLRDRARRETRRVNVAADGSETKAESEHYIGVGPPPAAEGAVLSADGSFIIFQTFAKMGPDDPDPSPDNVFPSAEEYDLFAYDVATRRLTRLADVRKYAGVDVLGSGRLGAAAPAGKSGLIAFHVTRGYEVDLAHAVHVYRWRQ